MSRRLRSFRHPVIALLLCLSWAAPASSSAAAPSGLQAQLDAMLAKVAGPGKGFVVVSEATNRDRTAVAQLRYGRAGVALTGFSSRTRWQGVFGGTAGASSVQWGRDTTVAHTLVAPGAVKRLDLAVVLDRSIPKRSARRIASALATASGLRRARGDRLTLLQARLPPQPTSPAPAAAPWMRPLERSAPVGGLVLAAVACLAFFAWTITRGRQTAT